MWKKDGKIYHTGGIVFDGTWYPSPAEAPFIAAGCEQ